jgi:hypothetical protein
MKLLRTIPWFTRLLVGLFLVAQLAGMVSSPRADTMPLTAAGASQADTPKMDASHGHHHHAQGHGGHSMPCGHVGSPADSCCALHACFAGLLPLAVAIAVETAAGESLSTGRDDLARGAPGDRLDRPPRPLH